MKTHTAVAALIAVLCQTAFAGDNYWNNIDNSFTNMLNHEPYAGPTAVTVQLGVKDPVELALHAPGVDSTGAVRDTYFANIDASFAAMLNHEPYAGETGVTVARARDHRVDRLVHALVQEQTQRVKLAATRNESAVK